MQRLSSVVTFMLSCQPMLTFGLCEFDKSDNLSLERRLPGAVIIGAKKAGTRALLEYLKQNPSIRAPGPEVHFLDRYYHYGVEWYRSRMPLSKATDLTVEKTPSYFVTKSAPKRLHKLNPNMKLLVVLRNPVTRAISDYAQNLSKKREYPPFERLALVCDKRTACRANSSWAAIRVGLYYKHVKRWLLYFPMKNFHFVDAHRLIADPVGVTNEAEKFLNLSVSVVNAGHFSTNSTKKFPCLTKTRLSCNQKNNTNTFQKCLGSTKGRQHPKVSNGTVQTLRRFYFDQNRLLFRLINRYFNW